MLYQCRCVRLVPFGEMIEGERRLLWNHATKEESELVTLLECSSCKGTGLDFEQLTYADLLALAKDETKREFYFDAALLMEISKRFKARRLP